MPSRRKHIAKSRVTIASLSLSLMTNVAAKPMAMTMITIMGPAYVAGVTYGRVRGSWPMSPSKFDSL